MLDFASRQLREKSRALRLAVQSRNEGRLFRRDNLEMEDRFKGSIDRFCEISLRLSDAKQVLDVGAGRGPFLSFLAELGHEWHALDVVDRRSVYPDTYGKGIRLQVCNVEADAIPYPDESFDTVVCCQVLEHFSHSHLPAVREMKRALRPGGV